MLDTLTTKMIEGQLAVHDATSALVTKVMPKGNQDLEEGSTTVEYAIGAVATAGLAGLLIVVLKSGVVKGLLQNIITQALSL